MSGLKIRCLGSFEVWWGGQRLAGFESHRPRSLLAYLVSNRERAVGREQLAELFWPDREQRKARHNLRQTLYNLRSVVRAHSGSEIVHSIDGGLRFDLDGCWIDIEQLEQGIRLGLGDCDVDVATVAPAVALYRGEFLADFSTKGSADLDFWLLAQRETYRELAIQGLRALVSTYANRGESRIGVQFAQRWVAIDPLSEEAARCLVRTYALAGRRSQALAAYEALRDRLDRELGVEPLDETTEVYEETLAKAPAADPGPGKREAIGPLIPMVGRRRDLQRLRGDWRRVREGRARFTLIAGESGVGKTRLANSMLGSISARSGATVLKARCVEGVPMPYDAVRQLIGNATLDAAPAFDTALSSAPPAVRAAVAALCPDLVIAHPDFAPDEPSAIQPPAHELRPALTTFLRLLCGGKAGPLGEPLVIFIEDLDRSDSQTRRLLLDLMASVASWPVWLLATAARTGSRQRSDLGRVSFNELRLDGFRVHDVWEIAAAVVREEQGTALVEALCLGIDSQELDSRSRVAGVRASSKAPRGEILPLLVVERINYLWSEGHLRQESSGDWRLQPSAAKTVLAQDLEQLVQARLRQLPRSARRLAALASVIGDNFEVDLLQEAADEHPAVVEVALELMLERWLIRQAAESWVTYAPERDIVRWSRGARPGRFVFAHPRLRQMIYEGINPLRRQILHRDVCRALAARRGGEVSITAEQVAVHAVRAREWKTAVLYGRLSAERAHRLGVPSISLHYCDLALESLERVLSEGVTARDEGRWRDECSRLECLKEAAEAENLHRDAVLRGAGRRFRRWPSSIRGRYTGRPPV